MVSKHASENFEKYARQIHKKYMLALLGKMSKAVKMQGSVACIVSIPPMKNDFRDDWRPNDRLVAIVRNRQVKTVMLSRASQINKSHLRTDRII